MTKLSEQEKQGIRDRANKEAENAAHIYRPDWATDFAVQEIERDRASRPASVSRETLEKLRSDTSIRKVITTDEVTKSETGVHAWETTKALEYLKALAVEMPNAELSDSRPKQPTIQQPEGGAAVWLDAIVCGDNVEVLSGLPADAIDLTVTSPPYDNLRNYGGHSWDFEALALQLARVTKPGGVIVWVVSDQTKYGSESGTSMRQALRFMELGLNLHDTMERTGSAC